MIRCSHLLILPFLAVAACSGDATPGISATPPSAAAAAIVLDADPGEATSVIDAKIETLEPAPADD